MESSPRAVFERLFGDGTSTDPAARQERMTKDPSILDAVTEKLSQLQDGLRASDQARLTDYLMVVRDIERRITRAEAETGRELLLVDRPAAGTPTSFEEHVTVLFDLQVLPTRPT